METTTTKLHTHSVDRLSSFINPRDVGDGRTGIAMPVAASAVPQPQPPPSFTAVRIEQFLTDVRRRVYGPVSAARLGRGGGGGAEEREGE